MKSHSSTSASTSTNTELTTKNLNVSGNTGATLVTSEGGKTQLTDNSRTTILNTDGGAIKAVSDVAGKSIQATTGVTKNALDIISSVNGDSLSFVNTALKSTQDVLKVLNGSFVDAVTTFEDNSQKTLGNTVSALNQIAKEQNQSADQLIVQASEDSTALVAKVFQNVAIAVAAGLILYAITKKG